VEDEKSDGKRKRFGVEQGKREYGAKYMEKRRK
jgi:hypothetical protein